MSIIPSIYRQQDLVGYWKLDEAAHSSTADNFNGDSSLDGNISGSPERRAGLFGGAFISTAWMTKSSYLSILHLDWRNIRFHFGISQSEITWGIIGRGSSEEACLGRSGIMLFGRVIRLILQGLIFIIVLRKVKISTKESTITFYLSGKNGTMSFARIKD